MESRLISEFMSLTGANPNDAMQCLKAWEWDLKRAITDYNDTTFSLDYRNHQDTYQDDIPSRKLIEVNNETSDSKYKHKSSTESTPAGITTSALIKRPALLKTDSIDIVDYRKLSRGISRATDNINLVSKARTEIAMDFRGKNSSKKASNFEQITNNSLDTPDFTFILPNIYNYKDHFRTFLEKDLIECSTLTALEQSHRLNWWVDHGICRKLWPLATTGDGNCLLHAASLGMWGFHDRKLTLRKALHSILSNGKCRDALWRRWRFQQTRLNKKAGFVYSEIEWSKEWEELVSMSSPEPRNSLNVRRRFSTSDRHSLISSESIDDSATYESLEEIHILALAHVLRRTIIVISDTVLKDLNGEAMAPITFGGIYLPFEISPSECNRGPLLLAYDMAHFSALVPMESGSDYPPALIPLVDFENILLPTQFCIDPGENFNWSEYDGSEGNWALSEREQVALLKEYLDIVYASTSGSPDEEIFEDLTDDEFEKKFIESEVIIPQNFIQHSPNQYSFVDETHQQGKSKAAKQLQSVAKQFGSIGKSMSKKIKKNIGSITKIGGKNNGSQKLKNTLSSGSSTQSFTCTRLLCAKLRIKRHEYQEEMIRNYLDCARVRYLDLEKNRDKLSTGDLDRHQMEMLTLSETETGTVYCINTGCNNYANSDTSYLCYDCFEKQKQRESGSSFLGTAPRYGTGKSKFYAQADINSHESIKNLPPAKRLNDLDQTLYLSNSTFYNDNVTRSNNSSSANSTGTLSSLSNGSNNIIGNNLVNRDTVYRHGYSPTVRLIDEQDESKPSGTVSVFSPGNTISNINNNNTNTNNPRIVHIPIQQEQSQQQNPMTLGSSTNLTSSPPTYSSVVATSGNNIDGHKANHDNSRKNEFEAHPCKTLGCLFYGTSSTNFYCSKCFQLNKNKTNENLIDLSSTTTTTTSGIKPKSTTIYPTATATITKTGSKIMSDI